MSRKPGIPSLLILLLVLTLALPAAVLAQDGGDRPLEETPLPEDLPGETPVVEEPPEAEKGLPGDWKIYVPFERMKDVFEKEGQGVFVPFAEFLKLWEASLDKRPVPFDPPVPWLVTRAGYEGTIDGDLAVIKASIEFETFGAGWCAVPLGLGGIALEEVTLNGEPATVQAVKDGYRVLVADKGTYKLDLGFVTSVKKSEDSRTISFRMPPVPVSRLSLTIPEEGARVTVSPNLATTRTEAGSGKTRVMAYVGASDKIQLTWRPRPVEVKEGPALVFADVNVAAVVEEAALRVRAEVAYRIHRAPVSELRLAVPEGAKVLFVEGENLQSWEIAEGVLAVKLHKPAEKAYRLIVTLETDRPERGRVVVPAIRTLGLAREQGFVLVASPPDVKVLPEAGGLFRTDFAEVPKPARRADMILAYRYPAHPWTLALDVARIEPVVDVTGRTTVTLDEQRLSQTDSFTFHVARAGIFQARVAVPDGLKVTDVSRDVVEDWRIPEEGRDRVLVLDLKGRRIGAFVVIITSTRPVDPGDEGMDLPLPLLTPEGVRRFEGMVGVIRDESLKIETKDVTGLVPAAAAQFGQNAALAYRYRQAERAATLEISLRDPEVTARVATALRAEENRIKVTSTITFTIRYAGVEEFSFLLPAELRDRIRDVSGNDIREKPVEELPEEGLIRQRVVLQGKVLGQYALSFTYDLPYEGLESGATEEVAIPALVVENVEREQGVYAVYRERMLEISAEAGDGLEPIDSRELPPGVARKDVYLAYKYLTHPHALSLTVVKHDPLPVLAAVVHHMHLVTALNEEGVARTEAVLKLTSNGLPSLPLDLGEVGDLERLEVWTWKKEGRPRKLEMKSVTPQKGADGQITVPLPPEAGPEDTFYIRLVYSVRGEATGWIFHSFTFPAPVVHGGEVPVGGTTWYLYPPTDVKITETGGNLPLLARSDSWWARVVNAFPRVFRKERAVDRRGRAQIVPGELTRLEDDLEGQKPLVFGGRSTTPAIEVTFADPGGFVFVKVLVLLAFLAWGIVGLRGGVRRTRVGFTTVCIALPLLLIPLASVGMAEVLSVVLLAGLVTGLYWCARAVGPGFTAWARSLRAAPPPDAVEPEGEAGGEEE